MQNSPKTGKSAQKRLYARQQWTKSNAKRKGSFLAKRFQPSEYSVVDRQTHLVWCRDAGVSEFPLTWQEAFEFVDALNRDAYGGATNWRLPNRRELFSLVSHERINPALPAGHPFANVFHGYYWSANTCARLPAQAWYVHFGGGKVYRGMKYASNMVWPVRNAAPEESAVHATGQHHCYDEAGNHTPCSKRPMQHAALVSGVQWPAPRFAVEAGTVTDQLTGLIWTRKAVSGEAFLSWHAARDAIDAMNRKKAHGFDDWRLPHIRELETLADLGNHSPALPADHPFSAVSDFYWSQTTSMYETRYAWAFYSKDGSVGVGFKENPEFSLWPVRGS